MSENKDTPEAKSLSKPLLTLGQQDHDSDQAAEDHSATSAANTNAAAIDYDDDAFVNEAKAAEQVAAKPNLPIVWVFVLANLLQIVYMLVQACTKVVLLSQDSLSAFELAFFRSLFNLLASSFLLKMAGDGLTTAIDKNNWHLLLVRCVSGSICFLCFVVAVKYLPLSIFFVIMNATPFFIALLACLWLKEMISLLEVVAMIGAFGGILLTGLSKQLHMQESEAETEEALDYAQDYNVGLLVALGCVLGQAVTMVTTRKLKALSVFMIQWYYALTSCLVTGTFVWLQEKKFSVAFKETSWQVWALIGVISILNNIGQNLGTWINQRANPATVGIFSYFGIGFSVLFDVFLFNLSFTMLEVLGVIICLLFSILAAVYKYNRPTIVDQTEKQDSEVVVQVSSTTKQLQQSQVLK